MREVAVVSIEEREGGCTTDCTIAETTTFPEMLLGVAALSRTVADVFRAEGLNPENVLEELEGFAAKLEALIGMEKPHDTELIRPSRVTGAIN